MRLRSLWFVALLAALVCVSAPIHASSPQGSLELAFFGTDVPAFVKDGRYIDSLGADDFAIGEIETPISGRDLARREIGGSNRVLVPLPKAERFAGNIMRRIIKGAGITGYQPKIEIVSDDRIAAAAYPDGTILISLGAFRNLHSSDELAAILAHELSHVVLGHHASDWFMAAQERGLAIYKLILDVKAQLDKLNEDAEDEFFQDLKNRMIAEAIVLASDLLVDAPFDRAQEDEADILGVDLMIKAGYDPAAAISMLNALIAQEELAEKEKDERNAQRRRNISLSQDRGLFSSIAGSFGEMALEFKSEIQSALGKEHRATKDRRSMVAEYLELHYSDPTLVQIETAPWQAMVNDPDVSVVLDGYRHAILARQDMSAYEVDAAAAKSRQSLSLLGSQHALPRKVAAEISFLAGDYERASRFLMEATTGYNASLSVYQGLAETQVKLGQPDAALATLQLAAAELKDPPQLLPSKISAFHWRAENQRSGARKADTVGLLAQCRLEIIPGLDLLCAEAAKGEFSVFNINLPKGMKVANVDPGTPDPNARPAKITRRAAPERPKRAFAVGEIVEVDSPKINARSGPGQSYGVVASVPRETILTVIRQQGEWIEVNDANGVTFWIAGWLTKTAKEEAPKPVAAKPESVSESAPVAETPSAAPENEDPNSVEARLRRAKKLYELGELTEEEYQAARKRILESL